MVKNKPNAVPKEELQAQAAFVQELAKSSATITAQGHLVGRAVNRLITALEAVDHIQQNALSLGTRSNTLMKSLGTTLHDLPGGMKIGLENAIGLMQAGFRGFGKDTLKLVQRAKVTSQDAQAMVAGLAKLSSVTPMSTEAMDSLADHTQTLSRKWGVQTGALINALSENSATISRFGALGGGAMGMAKSIQELVAKAGLMHKDTIGMIAEKFTFKDGFESLQNLMITVGDRDLVEQMRQGKVSSNLMEKVLKSTVDQYNEMVATRGGTMEIRSEIAKSLGFNVDQIDAMRAAVQGIDESLTLEQQGIDAINLAYSESISTMLSELAAPIQTMIIPALQLFGEGITALKEIMPEGIDNIIKFLIRFVSIFGGISATLGTIKLTQFLLLKKPSIPILATLAGLAMATYALMNDSAQKEEADRKNKERTARAQMRDRMGKTTDWSRYLTGQIIARDLATQNELNTEQVDATREMVAAIHKQADESNDRFRSRTGSPVGRGK